MKALFIGFLLNISVVGCIQVVEPLVPFTERLVVQSYISPQDSVIIVAVGKSAPLTGMGLANRLVNPKDVTVRLTAVGGTSVTLINQAMSQVDSANGWVRFGALARTFPVEYGKSYQLSVSHPQLGVAEGTCTVPARRIDRVSVNVDVSKRPDVPGGPLTVGINWKDPDNAPTYYSCTLYSSIELTDPLATPRVITTSQPTLYLSDENKTGDLVGSGIRFPVSGTERLFTNQSFVVVSVCLTDESYYQYNSSLTRQRREQTASQIPEPVAIVSNIRGGFGVFGAYTITNILTRL
ncbi:DUF4249 domain-containing protein [Spirosoma montaniterrae]|uniref:DUF4249 domain-containing protein n=1 Tax=Spirosoma montaniterrae TaxID=1178516 RepID=A0A1P9WU82_9BACT|nr:DUF4249 domain-containing protein [Spirosoma montaniterrae]AQG78945.1 hypothetical protein AWR27_06155 [Spirosoma montaniterrae]